MKLGNFDLAEQLYEKAMALPGAPESPSLSSSVLLLSL